MTTASKNTALIIEERRVNVDSELMNGIIRVIAFVDKTMPVIEENIDRWLDSDSAAKYLKVSKSYLVNELTKEIPYSQRHDNGPLVFDRHDLDAWRTKYKKTKKLSQVERSDKRTIRGKFMKGGGSPA